LESFSEESVIKFKYCTTETTKLKETTSGRTGSTDYNLDPKYNPISDENVYLQKLQGTVARDFFT
jgi:hypothetical protein